MSSPLVNAVILLLCCVCFVATQTPLLTAPLNITYAGVMSSHSTMAYGPPLTNISNYYNYQVGEIGELATLYSVKTYPTHEVGQVHLLLRTDMGKLKYVWTWHTESDCRLQKGLQAYTLVELLNMQIQNSTYQGEVTLPNGQQSELWQQTIDEQEHSLQSNQTNNLYFSTSNPNELTWVGALLAQCNCYNYDCAPCSQCKEDPLTCTLALLISYEVYQFDTSPIDNSTFDVPSFCPSPKEVGDDSILEHFTSESFFRNYLQNRINN